MERDTTLGTKEKGLSIQIKLSIFRAISFDEYIGNAFSLYLILNMLHVAASLFLPEKYTGNILTIIVGLLFWTYLCFRSHHIIQLLKKSIAAYLLAFLVLIIGIFAGKSDVNELFIRFLWLFAFGIPLYAGFKNISDTNCVLVKTKKCIFYSLLVALFTAFKGMFGGGIKGDYSMAMGYALLYPTLLIIYMILRKRSIIYILILAINVFVIISYGSRGQILSIAVFIILNLIFNENSLSVKKLLLILFCMTIGLVLYFNLETILQLAIRLLDSKGIQSRSLGYFLEKSHYTGREVAWNSAIQRIKEKPFLGWTVGVDTSLDGFYPHQLFLELLLHFGVIVGSVASVYIIILALKNIIIYCEHDKLTLLLFCYGFIPLMLTSEYLVWPSFWAFLGICIGRKKRINRLELPI